MVIVAVSDAGQEYCYRISTAHKVNRKKAKAVCEVLNEVRYMVKDGETWYAHEIGCYDQAWDVARNQAFTFGKTGLKRKRYVPCLNI